jgi:hypothetical protein
MATARGGALEGDRLRATARGGAVRMVIILTSELV